MNNLKVIHEQQVFGQSFKMYGDFTSPLFLAKDVAEWIEHSKTNVMLESIDTDEKLKETIFTSGQNRQMWFLTEDGLYEVLVQSRKPIAKAFKKEVKHILKNIRKHGGYLTPEKIEEVLYNPDTLIRLAQNLKDEQLKRMIAEKQIQEDKPYTNFGKVVALSDGAINLGAYSKLLYDKHGIKLGRNKLIAWLRDNGYLIKTGCERNLPKQRYVEQELFKVKMSIVKRTDGDIQTGTTLITGKGQIKIANLLREEFEVMLNG